MAEPSSKSPKVPVPKLEPRRVRRQVIQKKSETIAPSGSPVSWLLLMGLLLALGLGLLWLRSQGV